MLRAMVSSVLCKVVHCSAYTYFRGAVNTKATSSDVTGCSFGPLKCRTSIQASDTRFLSVEDMWNEINDTVA